MLDIAPAHAPFPTADFAAQFAGWVISALAGMLGAPFWFELLMWLFNLRGAGPKPDVRKPEKT